MRDFWNNFFCLCVLFAATRAARAEVRVSMQPELIGLMDRAVLTVEFINEEEKAVDLPEIDGLNFHYQGRSSNVSMAPGKTTRTATHTYLVTPSKTGDFAIEPITVETAAGEKELAAKLRVIKPKGDEEAQEISEWLFSRISSSRTAPHVHEPFELELKVHLRDGVEIDGSFRILEGLPQSGMDGDLQWRVIGQDTEEINGRVYKVWTLRSTAKTLTAGEFVFQPQVRMQVIVPRHKRRSYGFNDPFFGDMFGRQETRPVLLDCNKLVVNVRPIPLNGRPDSFTGGVGVFDFEAEVGPTEVKAGEPITVKTRIRGVGNLSQITPPLIAESHEFKLYDARAVKTDDPKEICFEQVVIPRSGSVSNIPAVSFSYFNTKTTDFRVITRGPFPVTVEDAPQQTAQVIATGPGAIQVETEVLGRDIVYLKSAPARWRWRDDAAWHERTLFRGIVVSPAALLLLVGLISRRRSRMANDVAFARRQKAPKAARAQLQLAERAARAKDETAFYHAAWNALAEYFGNRLNLAPGDVTKEAVLGRVPANQAEIERLFDHIERHRYGLREESGSKKEMKALARELTGALKKCERMKL